MARHHLTEITVVVIIILSAPDVLLATNVTSTTSSEELLSTTGMNLVKCLLHFNKLLFYIHLHTNAPNLSTGKVFEYWTQFLK